jgi:hypothetical protein
MGLAADSGTIPKRRRPWVEQLYIGIYERVFTA